jgi:hypothetical protein
MEASDVSTEADVNAWHSARVPGPLLTGVRSSGAFRTRWNSTEGNVTGVGRRHLDVDEGVDQ